MDEIADRHDDVGPQEVAGEHGLLENLDAFSRTARPIPEDEKVEDPLLLGQRQEPCPLSGTMNALLLRSRSLRRWTQEWKEAYATEDWADNC